MLVLLAGAAGLLLLALSLPVAGLVRANLPRVVLATPGGDLALAVGRLLPLAVPAFLVLLLLGGALLGWSLLRLV
ncbi:MAG: hypothetical protein U1E53_27485 [Dongiaceae bacterium]